MNWQPAYSQLALAHGQPVVFARYKESPADFRVEEELGFEPSGEGEHAFLFVEKTSMTTPQAQQALAQAYQVPVQNISYAGLKDKQAITSQWFSLQCNRAEQQHALPAGLRVLQRVRNRRKLQRGSHRGNRFTVVLRGCKVLDASALQQRLAAIGTEGVPNYFGEQRFGFGEDNLHQAERWFAKVAAAPRQRHVRGILLSAVRSFIFNAVLAERVAAGSWNRILGGEVVALAGSAATFESERASAAELEQRLANFDIHPSGPLWGAGSVASSENVAVLENTVAARYPEFTNGLVQHGLQQERRALRLQVSDLVTAQEADVLTLDFRLTRGAYATAVLRELARTEESP